MQSVTETPTTQPTTPVTEPTTPKVTKKDDSKNLRYLDPKSYEICFNTVINQLDEITKFNKAFDRGFHEQKDFSNIKDPQIREKVRECYYKILPIITENKLGINFEDPAVYINTDFPTESITVPSIQIIKNNSTSTKIPDVIVNGCLLGQNCPKS